ncbi:hypothetical protein [uncultured Paraglaciecola sp.]|uniref:hypothetical protein n=1 Tax=uncultured Paraglaciecola sp. TaxID=1765024 RepID=UPI00261692C4|nr:hypothetical protein [uncultured Paraglaciecola sp.]
MDINQLTIGQIKEIQSICVGEMKNKSTYPVGANVIVRTVTMIYTGKLKQVTDTDFILNECSWIPETGRYMNFVAEGKVNECEPYPEELDVFVNRGSLLDICEMKTSLPRSQK